MDEKFIAGGHRRDQLSSAQHTLDSNDGPRFNPPWTCVSTYRHEIEELDDIQAHFFGCIPFEARVGALHPDHHIWSRVEELEVDKRENLRFQRTIPESFVGHSLPSPRRNVAKWLQQERKRIAVVRRAIDNDPTMAHLHKRLQESRESWRNSKTYRPDELTSDDGQDQIDARRWSMERTARGNSMLRWWLRRTDAPATPDEGRKTLWRWIEACRV